MRNIILLILAQSILLGCLSSEKESDSVANIGTDAGNTAPTISGTPAQSTAYGEMYDFSPSASDADGDELTFSVSNKPGWASFEVSTGRLSGRPSLANIGDYSNIVISVSDGTSSDSLPAYTLSVVTAGTGNTAPTISGTPAQNINYGEMYEFLPSASDADGDELTFSVSNKPGWASFDVSTGRLSGRPSQANVGDYSNIVISVSDATSSDSLPAYTLSVVQTALGSVELSWKPPTQNSDGSPLMDLAGYKIYYRRNPGSYDQEISINNPSVTTYIVEQLNPATYYFAATSINSSGVESAYSAEIERMVN
jgi:hypothetical protein